MTPLDFFGKKRAILFRI